MDARTQRRINRAQVREKILKKEAEEKQTTRPTRNRKSQNETANVVRSEYRKVVFGYQSQVLSQMRVIEKREREISDLKRQLKQRNDELSEWKKWFNSLGVRDNMMNEN